MLLRVPPCTIFPESTPGSGGADPARLCWQLHLTPELHLTLELLGQRVLEVGPAMSPSCVMAANAAVAKWDSQGSGVQLPAPRQSGEQGVFLLSLESLPLVFLSSRL